MLNSQFKNLQYIESTKHSDIILQLSQIAPKGAHFTNGTYAYSSELIVPTALAGFKRVTQTQNHLPLVIAVNSDESMRNLNKKDFEPQATRAAKVAEPLAILFPDNPVVVIYYDATTPHELYKALKEKNLTRTLHKWGYGTNPQEPKIEGAEFFELVYAFPLPNDIKPVCYNDTEIAQEQQKITVDDLRGKLIAKEGILFELPTELQMYAVQEKSSLSLNAI